MPILKSLRNVSLAHISLTLVGLMWVLPFLYYRHAYPLTTFYQEWGAAVLGMLAGTYLLGKQYWQDAEIPRIVQLPILLMLLGLLQLILSQAVYFEQTQLFSMYLLWATLLMMLGHGLRKQLGMPVMFGALAVFLLLGAELNALIGILQHYRWQTFLDAVVTMKTSMAVYGNLAQPNHFASYIVMGLISLGLLRSRLRTWQVILLALPLLFVLVLSGSRSSWLYLLGMAALAFMMQHRDKALRHLLSYSLLLLPAFLLMHLAVQIPWMTETTGSVTTMQRLAGAGSSGSIRGYLWHEAWIMFSQSPLLGAGIGQFSWQHFLLVPELNTREVTGLYNNAHNLIMQLAAEMGVFGVAILLGALAMWLWRGKEPTQYSTYHWWGYSILLVLGIHSLLEYPLWYAYFLGVAAVLLGALDKRTFRLELSGLARISVTAILLTGMLSILQLQQSYQLLERTMAIRPHSSVDSAVTQQRVREGLIGVFGNVLLRPYAELFLNNYIEVSKEDLASKIDLNERSMRFIPLGNVVYRRAWLYALEDRQEEARAQLKRAIWSYPGDFAAQRVILTDLAQKEPEHYAALLKFGIEKYEEYVNAVPAK